MDVSVVVCTRNRSASLCRALSSLAGQRVDARWEVLVVDNDSEDDTAPAVAGLQPGFPVPLRLEREPQRGLSFARNRALVAARGRLLLYIDDDATCRDGWLAAHVRAFDDAAVVGTGGRILPALPDGAPGWFRAEALDRMGGPGGRYDLGDRPVDVGAPSGRRVPFGGNMGLQREEARAVGGFRADLGFGRTVVSGEDTELMNRLRSSGGRLVYVPDAVVDHHVGAERCNAEAFERWYRGFGRAAIRMDPPRSWGSRLGRAASASQQLVKWWLRRTVVPLGPEHPAYGRMLRKRAAARGRLDELFA